MTVGQARLARPEPSECFDSPGIAACGESAERGGRRPETRREGHASPARRSPAQSPLPRRRRDTRVGVGRPCNDEAWAGDGGEMNPPPTRASCRQLSPKVARPLGLPRLRARDLASPSHLGQRTQARGPRSRQTTVSPLTSRPPKAQRNLTPHDGCARRRYNAVKPRQVAQLKRRQPGRAGQGASPADRTHDADSPQNQTRRRTEPSCRAGVGQAKTW